MKKAFQQKHLERQITCVKASVPPLSFLEQFPACHGIRKQFMFGIMIFRNGQRMHRSQYRRAALLTISHFATQIVKVRIPLPYPNCVSETSVTKDHQILRILPMFLGLYNPIAGNRNANSINTSSSTITAPRESLADCSPEDVITAHKNSRIFVFPSPVHFFVNERVVMLVWSNRSKIIVLISWVVKTPGCMIHSMYKSSFCSICLCFFY
mmetsp:Transcript_29176/g.53392  ORF Transcript_29176/g.53392 Transcript_29176/m.53392 type:complete len:210 (+) Transcript_29176:207-836(+)